jgi:uridine kinase
MSRTPLVHLLDAIRSSSPPAGMRTRVIAIDGPGGAGKSSLADHLAHELDAPIIHTDEFASWNNPVDWWPELIEKVLRPIAAGRSARYSPTDWGGPAKPDVVIEPGDFVLLEGVTASREAFRPYLAFAVWIGTPQDVRLGRGLRRDGDHARADWERWMAGEDAYVERERPDAYADAVLPGDQDLWT